MGGETSERDHPLPDDKRVTIAKEFECERDGIVIRGADDDELVANPGGAEGKATRWPSLIPSFRTSGVPE